MTVDPYESPNENGEYLLPEAVRQFLRELWQSSLRPQWHAYKEFEQLLLQVARRYRFGCSLTGTSQRWKNK